LETEIAGVADASATGGFAARDDETLVAGVTDAVTADAPEAVGTNGGLSAATEALFTILVAGDAFGTTEAGEAASVAIAAAGVGDPVGMGRPGVPDASTGLEG
jgi:hypothetical protein